MRHSMVTTMPRVTETEGPKVVAVIPFMMPSP